MFMLFSLFLMLTFFFLMTMLKMQNNIFTEMNFFKFSIDHNISISYENMSLMFFMTVMLISAMIYHYSIFYLGPNFKNNLFCWILFFFVISMLLLISSSNIIMIMVGWDGLGVTSFLLVIFYNNLMSLRSGMATFITNRLGDTFLIISMIMMMSENILDPMPFYSNFSLNMVMFMFFFLSAMTKSAQLPFSAWLPAAMAAPTPISSLVHSSTLVTAGIYILNKYYFMMTYNIHFNMILSILAVMLSLYSGLMAFYETDFKKMIAMSTLSQLGILLFILTSNTPNITMFHTMTHAFFKSLLFLTAGMIMYNNLSIQDMRLKSSSPKNFYFIHSIFLLTNINLMGFPYTSGFFSKDMIITEMYYNGMNIMLMILLIMACIMTVLYTSNSITYIFNSNNLLNPMFNTKNNFLYTLIPNTLLSFMAMTFGFLFMYMMMDMEMYVYPLYNKIMGMILIFTGVTILCYLKQNIFLFNFLPIKLNNEFFLSMTNQNWMSNNMMTNVFNKSYFMLKLEFLWLEMHSMTGLILFTKSMSEYMKNTLKKKTLFVSFAFLFFMTTFYTLYYKIKY